MWSVPAGKSSSIVGLSRTPPAAVAHAARPLLLITLLLRLLSLLLMECAQLSTQG
jgi:hypothetical protein